MTPIVTEIYRAAPVMAVVLSVVMIFPFKAIFFKPSAQKSSPSFPVAFVRLTAEQEESAVRAAKTAWLAGSGLRDRMTARLSLGDLPEREMGPILGEENILPKASSIPMVQWPKRPFSPSMAAQPPAPLAASQQESVPPAFSKNELLQLDTKGINK